jgi:CRP-like cAMP-binding protein
MPLQRPCQLAGQARILEPMKPRTLARGKRLWARGEPALTIAIVESGRLAIRDDSQIFAVAFPGTVLGESAILGLDGPPALRTADVVALEPAVVSEYPITVVRDAFTVGTPRLILRTLFGQICRNALLVIGARGEDEVGTKLLAALLQSLAGQEQSFNGIAGWDDFMLAFRVLIRLRDASDAMRRELTPPAPLAPEAIERALRVMRSTFSAPESIDYLRSFIEAEQERRASERT